MSTKNDNIVRIGVNVFVLRSNKLLLGKRKGVGEGSWGLPGGHFEYGESMIGAAKRELLEETSLRAKNLSFLHIVNDPRKDDRHYVHICFLANDVEGEPQVTEPEKCYEWKWFDLSELPKEIFIGHQRLIPAFLKKEIFLDSIS